MTGEDRTGFWPVMTQRAMVSFVAVALAAASLAYWLAWRSGLAEQDARLGQSLILTRHAIESEIARFRALPDVVAEDARITAALADPGSPAASGTASRYLETVARKAGADELYLLDANGTVLSSSNWNRADSFVGKNYAFRPYFTEGLKDGHGRFYAIGITSGKPGYFLSTRVGPASDLGVVVVKINLMGLEATWRRAGAATAIADRSGVVFLSGVPGWDYRPLRPLTPQALTRIDALRTYNGVDLAKVKPLLAPHSGGALILPGPAGEALRARTTTLATDGWQVISAAPLAPIRSAAFFWALGAALVAMVATGLVLVLNQRRQLVQLRLRQSEVLEARVAERTRELAHEVEARRKTEADLRRAQEAMIHTEKMAALGRMSAAIVHEMGQPLAAMEATLAAAELSPSPEKTAERIGTARNLIRRIQRTTKHLKSFSRKEQNILTLTDLNLVAQNALDLIAPRVKSTGLAPRFIAADPAPLAMAGPVRLEQVCLNLLLNALDAVEGREGAAVTLITSAQGGEVRLSVRDTGPGISAEDLPRVTEPFFSTKIGGEGLGLGLSISQAIVTEFGGRLEIGAAPGGGAEIAMVLPRAETDAVVEAAQ